MKKTDALVEWRQLAKLLRYLKPQRKVTGIALVCLLFARGIEVLYPALIGQFAGKVIDSEQLSFEMFWGFSKILFALLVVSYLFDAIHIYLRSAAGQRGVLRLRQEVYRHILWMPIRFFDHESVGRLMTRTLHDIDQINQMLTESVIPLFGSFVLFIGILLGMFWVDARVAFAICGALPFLLLLATWFRKRQSETYHTVRSRVSAMNGFLQEHLLGVATVRHFGLEKMRQETFSKLNREFSVSHTHSASHLATFFMGIDFLYSALLITVFFVLTYTISPFQAGLFFTFSLYVMMLFRPLYELAEKYNVLQAALAAFQRVFDLLSLPPESFDPGLGEHLGTIESIRFENVWFAYRDEEWVLKGVSFELIKGESVALVGVTGGGKSTIMNLLLRFYDAQKGRILVNGSPLSSYSLSSLRSQICVVLQDPVIFSGTLRHNLTLGDNSITTDTLEKVAKDVNLVELLSRFPDRWDHEIREQGKGLSVGEMQLISLARAVCHPHSLLLLDEATATIDAHTEMLIQQALERVLHDKTSLVIAHRLSTLHNVDRSLIMDEGRISGLEMR